MRAKVRVRVWGRVFTTVRVRARVRVRVPRRAGAGASAGAGSASAAQDAPSRRPTRGVVVIARGSRGCRSAAASRRLW